MAEEDLLSWLGNFINFLILVYLTLTVVKTQCFSFNQLLIATIGLTISIAINIYTSVVKR